MTTLLRPVLIAALALGTAPCLAGQGFQVNEHGSCVVGRAGTGAAQPCGDGSSLWFNPAGIAGTQGWTVGLGSTVIITSGGFRRDRDGLGTPLDNNAIPIPHLYLTYGITDKLAAGLGLFVPYGLGTRWPLDTALSAVQLGATGAFEGRFVGFDNDLRSIYLQPTVAYRLTDRLAVGVGLDFVVGTVELTQRLDLSEFSIAGVSLGSLGIPTGTDFATARLQSSEATAFGGHFGIQFAPTDRLRLGARYMTRVNLNYDGRAQFRSVQTGVILPPQNPLSLALGLDPTQPLPVDVVLLLADLYAPGQPLADSTATTSITMPDQVIVGFAYDLTSRITVLGEWQWVHWSLFDEVVLDFANAATPDLTLTQGYRNTSAFRAGVEYTVNPRWTLRGGYLYHQAASPPENVTPLLPEGTRNEATIGVGIDLSDMFTIDAAYQYIRQQKRRGRVRSAPATYTQQQILDEINSGLFSFQGHIVGVTMTVRLP